MEALLFHPAGLVLLAAVLSAVSGVPALFMPRKSAAAQWLAAGILALAAMVGLGSAVGALWSPRLPPLALPWALPFGEFTVAVDGLSALFLLPIFLISPWARSTAWATGSRPSTRRTAASCGCSTAC